MGAHAYLLGFVLAVTAVAAVYDLRSGHIPNWLTLGALGVGVVANTVLGYMASSSAKQALAGAGFAIAGAAVCAAVPLLMYRSGAIGGGDVKLLAAIGAILRPMLGIETELYGFVAAAVFAPGWLAYEGKLGAVLGNTIALVKNPFVPKKERRKVPSEMLTKVRFGPAIFAGACGAAIMHWGAR